MPQHIIHSINEYEEEIDRIIDNPLMYINFHFLYRGNAIEEYRILPTICRYGLSEEEILTYESLIHEEFKENIVDGKIGSVQLNIPADTSNFLYDWHLLFQERHLELPSRLIDWSFDKLIALYFAVSDPVFWGRDGHVWLFPSIRNFSTMVGGNMQIINGITNSYLPLNAGDESKELLKRINPFDPEKITLVHTSLTPEWSSQVGERRRVLQRGKFMVHNNRRIMSTSENTFIGPLMRKIIIDGNSKQSILAELENRFNLELLGVDTLSDAILRPIPQDTRNIIQHIINEAKIKFIELFPQT